MWARPDEDSGLLALQVVAGRARHPARPRSSPSTTACSSTATAGPVNCAIATQLSAVLADAGADVEAAWAEVDSGRPLATVEKEHTSFVESHNVWGVPTFIVGDRAVFVRLLSLPDGDGELAISTVEPRPRPDRLADAERVQAHVHPALNRLVRCSARGVAEGPIDEPRMSDAEGLMWRLEKDPYLTSTFGTVSLLDRPPDFDRLRARMERAVAAVPRLGWRVQPAPVNLSAPLWVDDPDFEIDQHVRRIALPKPGTMRQLLDLATLLVIDPFDRTRPLWQFIVVEGLRGGKAALIQKMHHTITDGEGGVQMSLQYLDFERDAPEPPPLDRTRRRCSSGSRRRRRPPRRCATCSSAGSGCRSASPSRCATCSPTRWPSPPPARRRSTPCAASSRSCRTPSWRIRRCGRERSLKRRFETAHAPFRADQGRRQAARRHAQHGVPHRRRRGCLALPPGAR